MSKKIHRMPIDTEFSYWLYKNHLEEWNKLYELSKKYEIEQCNIANVVVNEAGKYFKPCGEGDNVCKCEDVSECNYSSEVEYCECLAPIVRTGSDNGYCANCGNDLR